MKVIDLIYWTTIIIMWVSILLNYYFRKKLTKKIWKEYQEFANSYNELASHHNERVNLLSKENNKLRSENEELKERLRDLGIKDFDVM
jgi:regulator of replication initiation timing